MSKGLREIGEVALAARRGSLPAAEQLWAKFVEEYPGARGIRSHWYSLDSPVRPDVPHFSIAFWAPASLGFGRVVDVGG
ncbi:hypothetical protein, partial [Agromyces bauzanensis]|uniref:hypothetical protein n=1 Tax=Agromyces bauzanensis TaxID=1308924 RepID=UPI0031F0AC51